MISKDTIKGHYLSFDDAVTLASKQSINSAGNKITLLTLTYSSLDEKEREDMLDELVSQVLEYYVDRIQFLTKYDDTKLEVFKANLDDYKPSMYVEYKNFFKSFLDKTLKSNN
jgi:hypothetical protein